MKRIFTIIMCMLLFLTACGADFDQMTFQMEEGEGLPAFGYTEPDEPGPAETSLDKDGLKSTSMRTQLHNSQGGQVVIRCENHNDYDVALTTDICFYDSQGNLISTACEKNTCLPAGDTGFLVFESESSFHSYSYDWTVVRAEGYHREALESLNMTIEKDTTGQLCYSITNEWEQQQELVVVIFFFAADSSLAGYDRQIVRVPGSGGIEAGVFHEPVGEEYVIYADYLALQ